MPHLPSEHPRYLMWGLGKPDDIIGAVLRGNAKFADNPRPLQENCHCPVCKNYRQMRKKT